MGVDSEIEVEVGDAAEGAVTVEDDWVDPVPWPEQAESSSRSAPSTAGTITVIRTLSESST